MVGDEATSMFAGQPQPVEIHHRGIWFSGELIGWRHESDGRVMARVRCRVDNLRHSAWVDLTRLRLPDPEHPPRKEPYPASLPRDAADPDDVDATRPHTMLAGVVTRAPKPAHATVPPSRSAPILDEPPYEEPAYESAVYEPAVYGLPVEYERTTWDHGTYEPGTHEPVTYNGSPYGSTADAEAYTATRRSPRPRRNEQLRRYEAYLSVL